MSNVLTTSQPVGAQFSVVTSNQQQVDVAIEAGSAPPVGGDVGGLFELPIDTATFVAPGASRSTSVQILSVPLDVGQVMLFNVALNLIVQADDEDYEVLFTLETSIDGGGTWQPATGGQQVFDLHVPAGLVAQLPIPMLGALTVGAPPADVRVRVTLENSSSSTSGVLLNYGVDAPGNPTVSFQILTAA